MRVGTRAGWDPASAPAALCAADFAAPARADAGDALLAEGTRVGEFEIRGFLGEGAMGQVYLAEDITLGRRIALKLIRRSVMLSDGVDRFLEEARATASFNHPHIVTLHAVGEHDGQPYLALEYIDGDSLRARLGAGPIPLDEALRHGRAVAEAIGEAHRRGLVHADLKPENVVIARDGRVRVVDFGLARLAGGTANSCSGTPAYMAPERWLGAPPTGAIDVWAFGIIFHELVTGHRPLADAALAMLAFSGKKLEPLALPAAPWASIVRDCLAPDPAARPSADELVHRLTSLAERQAAADGADARCPFPGLAAFSSDHAADHFGRSARLDVLVDQLRARPLIPVVGPPGVGKSSFVRAGLVRRLDEAGRWVAVSLRPGAAPFDNLAAALALPDRPAAELAAELRGSPDALPRALRDLATHHDAQVLLFVDQLEELFDGAVPRAEARAFCEHLGRAADAAEPWRIVLALRDDLFDRLVTLPSMRPHLGGLMRLGAPSTADLRAAIVGPLARAGYEPDAPALVAQILSDIEGQPACLSLLQLVCQALWERRAPARRRVLAVEYEAMGGAAGALAGHARRFTAELAPGEVRIARALLLALFHPGGARRPRRRGELLELVPSASREIAGRLLDRLLERRLLVETRPAGTLELGHDALATAWPQLARWLDETHDARAAVAALEEAASRWHRRGRCDDDTWNGDALADFARKTAAWHLASPATARAFLAASHRHDRRLRRRWRWLAVAAGVVAIAVAMISLKLASRDQATPAPIERSHHEVQPALGPRAHAPEARATSGEIHVGRIVIRDPAAPSFARE